MLISLHVDGMNNSILPTMKGNIDKIYASANKNIQRAGIRCQALAKQACPVDTGRLRNSILYHPYVLQCTVDTNVTYAPFVEMGTRHMSARPFLFPAYIKAKQELLARMGQL